MFEPVGKILGVKRRVEEACGVVVVVDVVAVVVVGNLGLLAGLLLFPSVELWWDRQREG